MQSLNLWGFKPIGFQMTLPDIVAWATTIYGLAKPTNELPKYFNGSKQAAAATSCWGVTPTGHFLGMSLSPVIVQGWSPSGTRSSLQNFSDAPNTITYQGLHAIFFKEREKG